MKKDLIYDCLHLFLVGSVTMVTHNSKRKQSCLF